MRTSFLFFCCMFFAVDAYAACNSNISASTPDSQLVDNGDGTITDSKTGLMWKKCLEGVDGDNCENNSPSTFNWQEALQQPGTVNGGDGFAGHRDWRLPDIVELRSLVEEQCYNPAINSNRFPNMPSDSVWSGSPFAFNSAYAWYVSFSYGYTHAYHRYSKFAVRLVRSGQ